MQQRGQRWLTLPEAGGAIAVVAADREALRGEVIAGDEEGEAEREEAGEVSACVSSWSARM